MYTSINNTIFPSMFSSYHINSSLHHSKAHFVYLFFSWFHFRCWFLFSLAINWGRPSIRQAFKMPRCRLFRFMWCCCFTSFFSSFQYFVCLIFHNSHMYSSTEIWTTFSCISNECRLIQVLYANMRMFYTYGCKQNV